MFLILLLFRDDKSLIFRIGIGLAGPHPILH
jgi:hypothetical protein